MIEHLNDGDVQVRSIYPALLILVCSGAAPCLAATKRIDCALPSQNCTKLIVDEIKRAAPETDLLVQTYYLTVRPIIDALLEAQARRVNVRIIVAKAMEQKIYCPIVEELTRRRIEVLTTDTMKVTNNKVQEIIIHQQRVIEGHFDIDHPPQMLNEGRLVFSENVPWISSATRNWQALRAASRIYECPRHVPVCPGSKAFSAIPACNVARSDEERAQTCCPTDCIVWMTRRSKAYYYKPHPRYGKTDGDYWCESIARGRGGRPAK